MPFIFNANTSKCNYKRPRQTQSKSLAQELNTILYTRIREKVLTKYQSSRRRDVKAVKLLVVMYRWQFLTKSVTHLFCQCQLPSPAGKWVESAHVFS